jgi:hypothetical protein
MKKQTNITQKNRPFSQSPFARLVLWVLLTMAGSYSLSAQCDLACNGGNPAFPLMIPVNDTCEISLVPESVLEVPIICPGDKVLTVRDTFNTIIVSGTNFVHFDPTPYDGQVLSVTVTDVNTGIFCNSFIVPADTTAPDIICTMDTISCIMDTSVVVLGFPSIADNCSTNDSLSLSYVDNYVDFGCQGTDVARLERIWTATDFEGNANSCIQQIFIDRANLVDIDFPLDTVLTCDLPEITLAMTGQPELFGVIIENTNPCDLSVTYVDDTTSICNNIEYQIQRTWTVTETCTNVMATDLQIITVVDTVAPVIVCPGTITTSTVPGACFGTVTLPLPDVMDNCDPNATFFVNTSYGQFGLGPHPFVPVGTHTVQYTSVDACGNTEICSTTVNVVDQEEPYAICEENTIVSVPSGGYAKVFAHTFDGGSNDNCAGELYFKVQRMITGSCQGINGDDSPLPGYQEWFDDFAWFCCDEVDQTVQIRFRVYEIDPGDGPVVPTREIPGGDLFGHFSECMVNVSIQDKIAPELICPHDTIINCTADYSDLSIFGSPMITDNCAFSDDLLEEVTIDNCSEGVITRTFFAIDPSGNSSSCIQTISVVNLDPLGEDNIIWPQDYEITVCGANTDPNDLPPGFNEPELVNVNCSDVGINYTDDFFNIAFPGCYKILRQWVVVDWCTYDPENPLAGGRFTDTQIIKVEDINPPILSCPVNDIVKAVSPDCSTATVNLDEVTGVDCNSNLLITNNSPFAFSDGPDASGVYPLGTTVVKYFASDRCGNVSSCEVSIVVEDQTAPAPICIVGLSINLSMMNGEPMVMLDAESFDGGSHDNCSSDEDLLRTIRVAPGGQSTSPPDTETLTFGCDDVGTKLIEFWVTDELGNSSHCVTAVAIQDNGVICPQAVAGGMITGDVVTAMGEQVEDVMIEVVSTSAMQAYTGVSGFFEILDVPLGEDYTVSASRNNDPLNGVSTYDLILISRHILGVELLDSPYKIIAADVNKSGSVSTLDLIALRKMILGVDNEFPNGNTSWRFIPEDYNFPNPANPFATTFPETMDIDNFSEDYMEVHFIAVKVGDMDDSASPNTLLGIDERTTLGTLNLQLTEREVRAGDIIDIPVSTDELDELMGYQFSLGYDTELLEFVELQVGNVMGMSEDNFNLQQAAEGLIRTSWHTAKRVENTRDNEFFTLRLKAKVTLSTLNGLVYLASEDLFAEAYKRDGSSMDINLNFNKLTLTGAQLALDFEVYQNQPNPFRQETTIGFELPTTSEAALYYYQVRTKEHSTTRKMILVK